MAECSAVPDSLRKNDYLYYDEKSLPKGEMNFFSIHKRLHFILYRWLRMYSIFH
jgi:hypothetical protein